MFCVWLHLCYSNIRCNGHSQQEKRIFTNFHRQLFCTIDKWVELTMDDIRKMEAETQKELEAVSTSQSPHNNESIFLPKINKYLEI